uniref:Uncharacterized protein n=1 Tax=Strongyloides stercoralis TaxID=6248 RepID=A0A0K0EHN3_STRER
MLSIRIFKILLLLIFTLITYAHEKQKEETIIIVGNSKYNLIKKSLISQLNVPLVKEPSIYKLFSIFTNRQLIDGKSSENIFNSDNIEIISYYPLNISIITSWKGIDEMSLDEITFFYQLIYQIDGGAGVIEIGDETKQLSAILAHTANCWGKGYIKIDITNRIFFCNKFDYKNFILLDHSKPIHNNNLKYKESLVKNTQTWSFNILGATYAYEIDEDNKNFKKTLKNVVHADVEKLKLIRRHNYANKKKVRRHRHKKIVGSKVVIDMSKVRSDEKKYECKYRKSCYTTGELNLNIFYKDPIQKESSEVVPLTIDQLKLICKYRKSCYDNAGIPKEQKIFLEESDDDKKVGLFTGGGKQVIKATKKNKKSLKNIAAKTLKNAQKKVAAVVEKLEENPNYAFEKFLEENEELSRKKQKCKFRKSCYETGVVPFESKELESFEETIQRYWDWIEKKFNFDIDFNIVKEEIPFDDLNEEDKKIRCRYRKSCYTTGIVPNISNEIFVPPVYISESPIDSIFNQNEENTKLACKYRKSCYETGVVPQILTYVPEVKEEIIPLDEGDFKVYCKFRKSCYAKEAKLEKNEDIDNTIINNDENVKDEIKGEKIIANVEEKIIKNLEEKKEEIHEEAKKKEKKQKKAKKSNVQESSVEITTDEIKTNSKKKDSKKEDVLEDKQIKGKKSKKSKKDQSVEKESINKKASKPVEPEKIETEEVIKNEIDNEKASKTKEPLKKIKKNKKEEKVIDESVEKITDKKDSSVNVENSKKIKVVEEKTTKEIDKSGENKKLKKSKQKKETGTLVKENNKVEKKNWYDDIDFNKYVNYVYDLIKVIQSTNYTSYFNVEEKTTKEHIEHTFDPEKEAIKLKCHYRKSCYETGEIPIINHHVFEAPPVEAKEHFPIFNMENENKKLACKYRKSCYESGEIPVSLYEAKIHEPDVKLKVPTDEEDLKIFCKYRKSCYETKIPPTLDEFEEEIYTAIDGHDIKTKCKYRKSCYNKYEDYESKNKDDKQNDKEVKVKKSKKVNLDDENLEKSVKSPKEHIVIDMTNGTKSISDDEIKILEKTDNKIKKVLQSQEDVKSSTNKPINCNPFRISCKQLLGIPLQEKAPRAKNGKKLCRKKKAPTS